MGKKKSGGSGGAEKGACGGAGPHALAEVGGGRSAKATVAQCLTSDPERLRKGLRKATSRKVDLVFPPAKEHKNEEREHARAVEADAVQALFADLQLHHQYGGQTGASVWCAGRGRVGDERAAPAATARPRWRWRRTRGSPPLRRLTTPARPPVLLFGARTTAPPAVKTYVAAAEVEESINGIEEIVEEAPARLNLVYSFPAAS
ncbi:hypothetical protein ZWY2020_002204 [Hordeum vulgare]|nr:hypothetical protein ZWY2020_002204 [Hordeum vulgare]